MSNHANFTAAHRPFAAVYADATARLAATGFPRGEGGTIIPFASADLYKEALQQSDNSTWVLTAITPTWVQVGGPGGVPGAHKTSHENGGADEINVGGLSGVLADPQTPITENVQDIVGALLSDNDDLDWTYNDGAGTETASLKGSAAALSPAFATLTDGATITWDLNSERIKNAKVTLGGNRTLDIDNPVAGATGLLIVTQDGTGSRTLALPAGSKVINDGGGAVTLSTAADSIDILTFAYDGTNYFWTIGKDYS